MAPILALLELLSILDICPFYTDTNSNTVLAVLSLGAYDVLD